MKKEFKSISKIIGALLILISISSCEKFSVLKNADTKHNQSGQNLLNKTIWTFISENNFHENDSTNIGLFGKAIEHAGLKDILNQETANLMVIIPTDNALRSFLKGIGYSSVTDVPAIILRNLLLNNLIDKRVRSFDLEIGKTNAYVSLSNDSLYITRSASNSSEYILTINNSSTASSSVKTQNLEFKNGVAHVANNFTYYIAKVSAADPVDPNNTGIISDTIYVLKDTYNRNGGSYNNVNYGTETQASTKLVNGSGNNAQFARRILAQYPIAQPNFNENIGTVKLQMFLNTVSASTTLNFYEDQNIDFNETTVNWVNAPVSGTLPIASLNLSSTNKDTWQTVDITSQYISYMTSNKSFINIGASITADVNVDMRTKEFDSGKFKSRIIISSQPLGLISPVNINSLEVESTSKVKALSLTDLKFTGTANKNISYTINALPQHGYLVINSVPAKINASFTQEQLSKGVVKYLFSGDGATTDNFTLVAKDFQGGIYKDPITMNLNIR